MPHDSSTPIVSSKKPSNKKRTYFSYARELIALIIWVYSITELFIYDLSVPLKSFLGKYDVLYEYRGLIILFTTGVIWYLIGNSRFFWSLLYLTLYPVVFTFKYILFYMFMYWPVTIAFAPTLINFILAIKYNVIAISMYFISAAILCSSIDSNYKLLAIIPIVSLTLLHYFHSIKSAFTAEDPSERISILFKKIETTIEKDLITKEATKLADASSANTNGIDKIKALSHAYTTVRIAEIFSLKISKFIKSRILDAYLVCKVLFTVFLTVSTYAFVYHTMNTYSATAFENVPANFSLWTFMGYSFETLMTSNISGIKPISNSAILISYSEFLAAMLLLVFFVFVMLTSVREKYKDNYDFVGNKFSELADKLRISLQNQTQLELEDVEVLIYSAEQKMVDWARKTLELEAMKLQPVAATPIDIKPTPNTSVTESTDASTPDSQV